MSWNVDLRSYFVLPILDNIRCYINIFNLFDTLNQVNVYNDSGRADRTGYEQDAINYNTDELINTVQDWFDNETFYSNPRRVEIGFRYEF